MNGCVVSDIPASGAEIPLQYTRYIQYTFGAEAKPYRHSWLFQVSKWGLIGPLYLSPEEVKRATTAGCPTGSLRSSKNIFRSVNLYERLTFPISLSPVLPQLPLSV